MRLSYLLICFTFFSFRLWLYVMINWEERCLKYSPVELLWFKWSTQPHWPFEKLGMHSYYILIAHPCLLDTLRRPLMSRLHAHRIQLHPRSVISDRLAGFTSTQENTIIKLNSPLNSLSWKRISDGELQHLWSCPTHLIYKTGISKALAVDKFIKYDITLRHLSHGFTRVGKAAVVRIWSFYLLFTVLFWSPRVCCPPLPVYVIVCPFPDFFHLCPITCAFPLLTTGGNNQGQGNNHRDRKCRETEDARDGDFKIKHCIWSSFTMFLQTWHQSSYWFVTSSSFFYFFIFSCLKTN